MPVSMDKKSYFDVVLKSDLEKPKNKQPSFRFRYMMGDEWLKLAPEIDDLDNSDSGKSAGEGLFDELGKLVTGWSNMGDKAYGKDKLSSFITVQEAHELLQKGFSNNQLSEDDEKK